MFTYLWGLGRYLLHHKEIKTVGYWWNNCDGNNNNFFKTPKNINIGSGEMFHFLMYNRRTIKIFLGEKSSDIKCQTTLCLIIFKYSANLGSQNTQRIKLSKFIQKRISSGSVMWLSFFTRKEWIHIYYIRLLEMNTGVASLFCNLWQVPRYTSMIQKIMKTNCPSIFCFWTSNFNVTKYKEAKQNFFFILFLWFFNS